MLGDRLLSDLLADTDCFVARHLVYFKTSPLASTVIAIFSVFRSSS